MCINLYENDSKKITNIRNFPYIKNYAYFC